LTFAIKVFILEILKGVGLNPPTGGCTFLNLSLMEAKDS